MLRQLNQKKNISKYSLLKNELLRINCTSKPIDCKWLYNASTNGWEYGDGISRERDN